MKKLSLFFFLIFSIKLLAVDVCFVATQVDSAEYFMQLAEILEEKKISWEIWATDDAEAFFKHRKVSFKKLSVWMPKKRVEALGYEDVIALAKVAAKECKKAKIVITETGDNLIPRFHYELALISSAQRWVFHPAKSEISHLDSKGLHQLLKTHPEGVICAEQFGDTSSHQLSGYEKSKISKQDFFDFISQLRKGFSAQDLKNKVLG